MVDGLRNDADRPFFNALADPRTRAAAVAALVRHWRVDAVLILIRDRELGVLYPAPGFAQTLPGGPSWRDLLARCSSPGAVHGQVAYPDRRTMRSFTAQVGAKAAGVLVLIGDAASDSLPADADALGFPLLVALLQGEAEAVAAQGRISNAMTAQTQAEALTGALDAARRDLAASFARSAELNTALSELNGTLEIRVAERTRQLEAEMVERQKTEELLRQSQKMEAVGQLTGGLAHDFNNLLTGVTGALDLMQTRVNQGRIKDIERYIGLAQGAAKRAASLTHRLLAFARRQTLDPKPTNANRLVAGMEELIRRTVGPAVQLEIIAAGGLWPCLVDPNQLENALLNLCINARDAMPGGGRLTVETANRWFDHPTGQARDMPPGQYISLCVSDTGTGMTSDVVAKAFDPFFTTKPLGQGTGLGLSMIYGFARQSDGQARIYSEPGQGTTVCIYLPRHRVEDEVDVLPAVSAAAARAGVGETVLVVDDEPTVRVLVTEVLEELGYAALEAADGASGLKLLQSDIRIDLLISDVGLPGGMSGRQMADAARLSRPDLKVLFITGYAENAVVGNGHLEAGMHVLTKPFAMDMLAARIQDLINTAAPQPAAIS